MGSMRKLSLPKIAFNLVLFDDTTGSKTTKRTTFVTIREIKRIRSNVDHPEKHCGIGNVLRERIVGSSFEIESNC